MILTACSQAACISCCTDVACEGHKEAREAAQWKEDVLKGTTDVQQQAKAKRAMAVLPGSFRESGFLFLNQTITIWNRQDKHDVACLETLSRFGIVSSAFDEK